MFDISSLSEAEIMKKLDDIEIKIPMASTNMISQLEYYKNMLWNELQHRKMLQENKPEKPKIYAGPDVGKPIEKSLDKPVKTAKPIRTLQQKTGIDL